MTSGSAAVELQNGTLLRGDYWLTCDCIMVWWLLLTSCHAFVVFVTYTPGTHHPLEEIHSTSSIVDEFNPWFLFSILALYNFVNFSFIYLGFMEIKRI